MKLSHRLKRYLYRLRSVQLHSVTRRPSTIGGGIFGDPADLPQPPPPTKTFVELHQGILSIHLLLDARIVEVLYMDGVAVGFPLSEVLEWERKWR